MKNGPLFSIVVITYNSARFVLETLESTRAQTYANIELIISDDGSADDTVNICRKWLKLNQQRYIRTEFVTSDRNTGISANCNRGIKEVRGEWIKIIAGDDALFPDAIEKLVKYIMLDDTAEWIMTQSEIFRNSFEPENAIMVQPSHPDNLKIYADQATASDQLEYLLNGGFHYTTGLFLKNAFQEVGLYDEKFTLIEDVPFYLKLGLAGKKIRFAPIVTVKYRKHHDNLTSDKKRILPSYYLQTYAAASRASLKYGKIKYIANNYWHKMMITLIFCLGNRGIAGSVLNRVRTMLQPIRLFNLMSRVAKKTC